MRASRPFLTLYFVPVIPIGGLQEYVECRSCKNSFESVVLASRMVPEETPVEQSKHSPPPFEQDLLRVIALMMVEDGHVTENEIVIARRLYENITQQNLSREELGAVCSQVRLHRLNTGSFLATAGQRCTHEQKLLLVQAMFGVAGADGDVTPKRMESLIRAQKILKLEEREFETAVNATSQWLT